MYRWSKRGGKEGEEEEEERERRRRKKEGEERDEKREVSWEDVDNLFYPILLFSFFINPSPSSLPPFSPLLLYLKPFSSPSSLPPTSTLKKVSKLCLFYLFLSLRALSK